MKSLIFDTETTGLIENSGRRLDKQPRIIEFSALLIEDDGIVLDELDFLCYPGMALDPVITKITGLRDEDLRNKPLFASHIDAIDNLLSKADAVVAHNLYYDYSMVNFEAERAQKLFPFKWPAIKICTVEQTEFMKGFRLSLSNLHLELFCEAFEGAHRAAVDVKALARCYVELIKRGDI